MDRLRDDHVDRWLNRVDGYYESLKKVDELEEGHKKFRQLRAQMAVFDVKIKPRSRNQQMLQDMINSCICPLVYGDLMKVYQQEILKQNKFEKFNRGVIYQMPRRTGKTFLLAQWIASAFMTIPNISVCLIGPSSRAATSKSGIMELVKDFLRNVIGWKPKAEDTWSQEFVIMNVSPTDKRKFSAYPGGATNKYVFFSLMVTLTLSLSLSLFLLWRILVSRPARFRIFSSQIFIQYSSWCGRRLDKQGEPGKV